MWTNPDRNKDSATLVLRRDFPLLGPYVAPRTPTERKLAEIFCDALSMDEVGIFDDFEELSGDSLIAAEICTHIEKAFAISVPIATLLRSATIEKLAPRIDALASGQKS